MGLKWKGGGYFPQDQIDKSCSIGLCLNVQRKNWSVKEL